ncbi:MAG: histidine kinase [Gammaproteobacteria bacterium]|nr:histidine kinase [Gammaproteobacteria bacterium]
MAAIVALAVIGMGSSVLLLNTMRGEAAAINDAGALRMGAYMITTQILAGSPTRHSARVARSIKLFDMRLHRRRITAVLANTWNDQLRGTYESIVRQWNKSIRPLLQRYSHSSPASQAATRVRMLRQINEFVSSENRFVTELQHDAESKIRLLGVIQAICLFLMLIVVYVTMRLMHTTILRPLADLLSVSARVRAGDFTVRARHVGNDELGKLGSAFNVMGEDLSKIYVDLERRVAEKTANLARRNRSLALLYTTSRRLNETPVSEGSYRMLLRDISDVIGLGPGSICIACNSGQKATRLAATIDPNRANLCNQSYCVDCLAKHRTCVRVISAHGSSGELRVLSVPLIDLDRNHGVLLLQLPDGFDLEAWEVQLVETIGRHIGIAIGASQRLIESRRLALFEERSAMARELHDSLAQSLSYLKIQISRLQSRITSADDHRDLDPVVREMREGVTGAYRQLRELLTTFRLKVDGRGLEAALAEAVSGFRNRGELAIALVNDIQHCNLSANEEIHLLQIVREALSNVLQHAHARQAWVSLRCEGETAIVIVDDDGIGLGTLETRTQRYGLVIMQERANRLAGTLKLTDRPEGGARVELRFVPAARQTRTTALEL